MTIRYDRVYEDLVDTYGHVSEDVARSQCVRRIVNLLKEMDENIDQLIHDHTIKFKKRAPNEDEWRWILKQARDLLYIEEK